MSSFNPSETGQKGNLFGFPYSVDESDLVIVPIPWDVTTSFMGGASKALQQILEASTQLDFEIPNIKNSHEYLLAMNPISSEISDLSVRNRSIAKKIINDLETGYEPNIQDLKQVNSVCVEMNQFVTTQCQEHLDEAKIVATLGGDHSTPLGLINALTNKYEDFGILQIDAHMDLRKAYGGFEFSHASIMHNVLKNKQISKLVQVGIRDYCKEESDFAQTQEDRVVTYFDERLAKEKWSGVAWPMLSEEIIDHLPGNVYVSFDMDGLEPSLCSHTGTPVPGGLGFYEALYLVESVVRSGRQIIGFDVSECGNHPWDANVASRILHRISSLVGVSRGHLTFS